MKKNRFQISRVNRLRSEAIQIYDRYSRWYDWISGQFERKFAEAGVAQLDVQQGERILEIGYGTGHMLVALADQVGPTGMVDGIDISKGMYEMAKNRIQKSGLSDRVQIVCGDAITLPFESNTFDGLFMSFTLLEVFESSGFLVLHLGHLLTTNSLPICDIKIFIYGGNVKQIKFRI